MEEGRRMSGEMATENAKRHQEGYKLTSFEKPRSVTRLVAHFFRASSWRRTFFLRHSLFDILRFPRRRLVDGFTAPSPRW